MGQSVVVLGAQWGDEGKGKIVDLLTQDIGAVVRFQGGHNAGHTLVIGFPLFSAAFRRIRQLSAIRSLLCLLS